MKSAPCVDRAGLTTRRKASNKFSRSDIGPAIDLFISHHPHSPRPDAVHSAIRWNVIVLKNSIGVIAVATHDGRFLASIGGPEYEGG